MSIGDLAAIRDGLREQKRELEARVSELNKALEQNEQELIEAMTEAGIDKTQVGKLSLSVSTQTLPVVEDWDAFHQYILDNKYLHLLHRRVSSGPFKEILEMDGAPPPGTDTVTKTSINMRKTN